MLESTKTLLFHFFLLSMFGLFLIFPVQTLNGAASGLLLWYNILLPSLLPFIMLTSIIIKTQAFSIISKILGPTIGNIFQISQDGSLAIIIGFLCGYPMGAKVINDLYENKNVSLLEAQYLLSFCNNTSPMFIISFFLLQILEDYSLLIPVLVSLYVSPFIMSCITRRLYHVKDLESAPYSTAATSSNASKKVNREFSFQLLDEVIIESITLIMKIGGYVMLFSIFISLVLPFARIYMPILLYLVPLLEITNGLELYKGMIDSNLQFSCMLFLVSFGGLCSIGQTRCVLQAAEIKIAPYFLQKIITAFIAVIISYLLLNLLI